MSEERARSIFPFEATLFAASGAVGLIALSQELPLELYPTLIMLGLPLAAAILAGAFARHAIENSSKGALWISVLTLPAIHIACLLALAMLLTSRFTGLEAPEHARPALMWLNWKLLFAAALSEGLATAALIAVYGLARRKKA
jgi:hypothetical protein